MTALSWPRARRSSGRAGVSGDSRDSADIFQMVQLRMRDAAVAMQIYTGDAVIAGRAALADPENVVQVDFLECHPLIREMAAYRIPFPPP